MIKNKKQKRIFILSLLVLFILSITINLNTSFGETKLPEPSFEFYVYDEVGIISSEVENYIIGVNREMYEKIGAQVVVAVVDSLQDLDINTYATSLFKEWEIGGKKYDNGLLLLIMPVGAANQRKIWIETGYGLEGALPAGIEKRIIEQDIIPSFKNDDYNEGIALGFNSIIEYIEKDFDIVLDKQSFNNNNNNNYNQIQSTREIPMWPIILFLLVFGFIDIKFFRGMLILSILRAFFSGRGGPGGYGGGGGFGGGSSGGSSGGGGRSGGGGAGGSW